MTNLLNLLSLLKQSKPVRIFQAFVHLEYSVFYSGMNISWAYMCGVRYPSY